VTVCDQTTEERDVRVRSWLFELDERQLQAMCERLRQRDGRIAPRWSEAEIDELMKVHRIDRARRFPRGQPTAAPLAGQRGDVRA
jgi:hypothetical protein